LIVIIIGYIDGPYHKPNGYIYDVMSIFLVQLLQLVLVFKRALD